MTVTLVKSVEEQIGQRIREARRRSGRTLADLAAASQLSEGFLSRVERGHASCSIANLIHICSALSIDVEDLFVRGEGARRTRVKVHRAAGKGSGSDELEEVEGTGYRFRHLAGGSIEDDIEVYHLVFPRTGGMETRVSHPGQEHCYVLSGTVEFMVGDERYELTSGDGILIDSTVPHRARSLGGSGAEVLMTVSHAEPEQRRIDWWGDGPA